MSELSRLFLPLDTLAGWPLVLYATPLNYLLLFIAIPAVAFAVIASAVKVTSNRGRAQPSDTDYADPVWTGPEPTGGTPGHQQQRDSGPSQSAESGRGGRKGRGGASARW